MSFTAPGCLAEGTYICSTQYYCRFPSHYNIAIRFDELRALKPSVEESRAVTVLKDVRDAIDKGCVYIISLPPCAFPLIYNAQLLLCNRLSCHLKDSSLENVIVCHALRLVATDVEYVFLYVL